MAEVFPIVPAAGRALWMLAGVLVLLIGIASVLAYTAYSTRAAHVELETAALRIRGDLWGRAVPIASLELESAAVVDLAERAELSLQRRTLGTGLPGYASGWFRLANGEKALVVLTRRTAVLHLPTSEGYSLLLSVERPHELLEGLRARATGG